MLLSLSLRSKQTQKTSVKPQAQHCSSSDAQVCLDSYLHFAVRKWENMIAPRAAGGGGISLCCDHNPLTDGTSFVVFSLPWMCLVHGICTWLDARIWAPSQGDEAKVKANSKNQARMVCPGSTTEVLQTLALEPSRTEPTVCGYGVLL